MATFSTTYLKESVKRAIKRIMNRRSVNGDTPNGVFLLKSATTVAPASYDVLNDSIQLMEFPPNTFLLGASVTADKEYDTGGTAARLALVLDDGDPSSFTSAVGSAFGNQPANDGIEVLSSNAADITQTVTIIGTTTATDTVVVETVALDAVDGTTVVPSLKTDWGQILGVSLSAACVGTITVQEASGNADIITLAPGVTSVGIQSVTSTERDFNDALVRLVCSGTGTKQIGLKGTDTDGTVIYDSQALNGATQVLSNSRFVTVDTVYTGDLEATRTVTISSSYPLLATASQFATGDPVPLNYNGAAVVGGEFGVDVGDKKLALVVEVAPTTANSSDITFTTKALVYHGTISNLN